MSKNKAKSMRSVFLSPQHLLDMYKKMEIKRKHAGFDCKGIRRRIESLAGIRAKEYTNARM